MTIASIGDFRKAAQRRLPGFLFDYIDGGSFSEGTLKANVDHLAAVSLRQRVLRDVSDIDLSTEVLGQNWAMPVALGPVGLAGLFARRGECQAVRAANRAGVPFALSTVSACSLEEVASAATAPFWFQLYMLRDRGFMREMLARARAAQCPALIFTVDLPVSGIRYRDIRSGQAGAPHWASTLRRVIGGLARPDWCWNVAIQGRPLNLGNIAGTRAASEASRDYLGWVNRNFDPAIAWRDLDFIRSEWNGPLILKGILDPEDAQEAARLGADGLVVSNHGGRQLDGARSTAECLPAIAEAVGDRMTVLADGGVRSGLDVLRLLALGAKGVLLGRAWAWALAAGGEAGVSRMLALLEAELRVGMALTGVNRVDRIDASLLA